MKVEFVFELIWKEFNFRNFETYPKDIHFEIVFLEIF